VGPEGRRIFPSISVEDNSMTGAFTRSDAAGVESSLATARGRSVRLRERFAQAAGAMSGGEL
jgi:branched-chain amino acid transport system ATP-binding protein